MTDHLDHRENGLVNMCLEWCVEPPSKESYERGSWLLERFEKAMRGSDRDFIQRVIDAADSAADIDDTGLLETLLRGNKTSQPRAVALQCVFSWMAFLHPTKFPDADVKPLDNVRKHDRVDRIVRALMQIVAPLGPSAGPSAGLFDGDNTPDGLYARKLEAMYILARGL